EEDREEEPALAGPDLSDVREPEVVGGLGGEVAGDPVRRGGQVGRAAGGDESEPSSCAASQALQLHKPGDAMLADGVPRAAQGAVDSRRAVDAPALAVHGAAPVDQDRALPVPLTAGPPAPGVEAAARHAEDAAQLADSEFAGLLHEPELHFRSFAKYAKAFFKMSRSWVTSRSFCSSSRTRRACGARRPRPGNASVGVSVSCSRHRCSRLRAIPRCVATSVNDFPSSTTRWTASFLNCGVKVRRTRIVRLPMDHLVRASHGSYLGVHFSGELHSAHTQPLRPSRRLIAFARRMPSPCIPRPSACVPSASTSRCTWFVWTEKCTTRKVAAEAAARPLRSARKRRMPRSEGRPRTARSVTWTGWPRWWRGRRRW